MSHGIRHIIVAAAIIGAAPAIAADNYFAGRLDLRAGYGSNPFLRTPNMGGSALLGGTAQASLNSKTARSLTSLTGTADITHNFNNYGRNENYTAELTRNQTFSDRLVGDATVRYANTINPGQLSGFDSTGLDLLTIGQRTETISGNAGFSYVATSRDRFSASANASKVQFGQIGADYTNYGGSLGYMRTIDARTSVGVNVVGNWVESDIYGQSSSYNIGLQGTHQFNAIWSGSGSVGAIVPRGRNNASKVSASFSAQLCGKYPRTNICFNAARQATPSGIGGLRNNLIVGARLDYQLDERQTINVAADYNRSSANEGVIAVPKQTFYQASGGYSRLITERISVGASGRYQRREYGPIGSASGYAVTIDVTTRLGRLTS